MITNVRGRGQVEHRSFALTDMIRYGGGGGLRNLATPVNETAVKGIPALYRAARIKAEGLAGLRFCVWRGYGVQRSKVETDWRARLFERQRANEYQTRFIFWETIGESLAWRNNAYVWKLTDPLTLQVIAMYALHPDQVKCTPEGYKVTVADGYVDPVGRGTGSYDVGDETILHIRGHGNGGTREAPTPIQVFRESLEAPVARQRHETRIWRRGTSMQVAVVFPQGVTKEQADEWKQGWREEYAGTDGETTPMMGGGADIKPIGMTQADALYAEMAKLTVQDASRIMGVPANLLGVQMERAVPNLEQDLSVWLRFGQGPDLNRIESAVAADDELFGSARLLYPAFDTEEFVRGDLQTEDNIAHQRVQDGRLLVDEWRANQGLGPLPNGMGKIPQVVPVGGGPNPNPKPVAEPSTNGAGEYE